MRRSAVVLAIISLATMPKADVTRGGKRRNAPPQRATPVAASCPPTDLDEIDDESVARAGARHPVAGRLVLHAVACSANFVPRGTRI